MRDPPGSTAHPKTNDTKSSNKRARVGEAEISARYRGCCRYALGYSGPPGSGASQLVQKDRILVDAAAITKFCSQVLQHGFSGSMGGRGSRIETPHPFCEAVAAGEISADKGDRIAVVFSKTPGVKQLRILNVVNTKGSYVVQFSRPSEVSRMCFQAGYGSFSLALLRNADEATADEFKFKQVDGDGKEHNDYIQLKDEEESDEDGSEEEDSVE